VSLLSIKLVRTIYSFYSPHISYLRKEYQFKASSKEGAILILPEGGTREDMRSTDKVQDYVAKNAFSWYLHANSTAKANVPNGSLFLILGRDAAMSYDAVSFSGIPLTMAGSVKYTLDNRADDSER
jgi:hypothetical protein